MTLARLVTSRTSTYEQLGVWLTEYMWRYFVTLTVAPPMDAPRHRPWSMSADAMQRAFFRTITRLEKRTGDAVPYFFAIEGVARENVHLHALLGGRGGIGQRDIEWAWRLGAVDFQLYDPSRGAASYMTKEISSYPDNWGVSGSWPIRIERATILS